MTPDPTERLNVADHFLDARVREGHGERPALHTDAGTRSYGDVQALANRFARVLAAAGVEPEQRVMIALPDSAEYVGTLFGTIKLGAVAVMVNPALPESEIAQLLDYTRASAIVTDAAVAAPFQAAALGARAIKATLVVGEPGFDRRLADALSTFDTYPSHRDDAAIWLFSGGTSGQPKAVPQSHRSFANTTQRYAIETLGYSARDVTLSVPKLYFGYATGSNLLFPFAVGGSAVLFRDPPTAELLFDRIAKHRPTILVNVPTMINKMVSHPAAATADLSSLRLATSAGEALPVELHERWNTRFGVPLLDGLGTAEMWHIFITNRPDAVRPGTLGTVVNGFDVKVCDDDGRELPRGETGWLWVRGDSRALGYWQHMDKTAQTFRGEWVVSGDLIQMDADSVVTYHGRGDELLKIAGKWLAPQEVESCLLQHAAVVEVAVVGMRDASGLMKPLAFVVARERREGLEEELKRFVRERLQPHKHPREVYLVDALPRTHLGKVDRGKLRRPA